MTRSSHIKRTNTTSGDFYLRLSMKMKNNYVYQYRIVPMETASVAAPTVYFMFITPTWCLATANQQCPNDLQKSKLVQYAVQESKVCV